MMYAAQRVEMISVTERTVSISGSWEGARGDGLTDDTAAIQLALDAAGAIHSDTSSRASVFLPPGVYVISRAPGKSHCLSIPTGVHFFGPGRLVVAAGQPHQTSILAIENATDVIVEGVTIDGNAPEQTTDPVDPKKRGVFVRGSRHVILRNIIGTRLDGDLFYFGKDDNSDAIASHCLVENFRADGSRRSLVTITAGASYITVRGGYGVNWSGQQSAALNIESDGNTRSTSCRFEDIHVDTPAQEALHTSFAVSVSHGDHTVISGCTFKATLAVTNSNDVVIADNIIDHPGLRSAGGSGIQARYTCERLRIERNTISVQESAPDQTPAELHVACIYVLHRDSQTPSDVVIRDNSLFPGSGLSAVVCASLAGTTTIASNKIDGRGRGRGVTILLDSSDLPFPDVMITENTIRNVVGTAEGAIHVSNGSELTTFERITIATNRFTATQANQTLTTAVNFGPSNTFGRNAYGDVLISQNAIAPVISQDVKGLGWWRTGGNAGQGQGSFAEYEGVVSPENQVSAGTGSTYRRRTGGTGPWFYVKEAGSDGSGWAGK